MIKNRTASNKNLGRKIKARWQLYLMLALLVAYFLVFFYYPMFGIQLAFKKFNVGKGIWGSQWIGFNNFKRFRKIFNFI